jgi:hypothetical protein
MTATTLCCYDCVNQPYVRVREALLASPHYVFRHATAAAATQAAMLHVQIGAIDFGTAVAIALKGVDQDLPADRPMTRISLEWRSATSPRLFSSLTGTLAIFPLTPTETQLELSGHYTPPLGAVGEVLDSALGHRLAKASVDRFIKEVAGWLREELTAPAAIAALAVAAPSGRP